MSSPDGVVRTPGSASPGPLRFTGAPGEYLCALGGLSLGVYVLIGAGEIRIPPGTVNAMGPRSFPYLVGGLLVLASLLIVAELLRGKRGQPEEGEDVDAAADTDWRAVGLIAGLFLGHAALIGVLGWPIAVGLLFAGTALVLGARSWWRALLIGMAMGLIVQYLFGTVLGLSLPAGPLLDWIPIFHG